MIRAPLLGTYPTVLNLAMVAGVTLFGTYIAYKMLIKYRARIVYWL